ncbi:MAG: lactate utilization protein [Sporomusaceae bacterium]|nr:lactate utilization protein [Sporomusaceae bacterium]
MTDANRQWHNETIGKKTVEALRKNRFSAEYFASAEEAKQHIFTLIAPEESVGIGGSATVKEIGLLEDLAKRGNLLLDHGKAGLSPEESLEIRRKQLTSDVFLTSTNAVTLDGQLVNVDGSGNRVAAMIFGPKKVVVVVGLNKIVGDIHEGFRRIQHEAAPINNKRLNRPNPCTVGGVCMNCQGPTRICNVTTIIEKALPATPCHVIIIGETLGY